MRPQPWPVEPPSLTFTVPPGRVATEPPEARGLDRDGVRLLVARPRSVQHTRFHDIGRFLDAGDLLVVNTSATLAAALDARRADGREVVVHVSGQLDVGTCVVELRRPDGSRPQLDGRPGEDVQLPAGVRMRLLAPGGSGPGPEGHARVRLPRLWQARLAVEGRVADYLAANGRPISYGYLHGRWPLSAYQSVFAADPGSAEMASAGRPFTADLVTSLVTAGVVVAPVLLHTGVSSLEAGEPPQPERFRVPASTARLVNATRAAGGRVVAVGTTVTRALESAVGSDGAVHAAEGWTDLLLGPERPARVVAGLVTGWHPPDASHLLLLEAVAGRVLVAEAYGAALAGEYLWHEFGDSCLLLPSPAGPSLAAA